MVKVLKHIVVSEQNYEMLRKLGHTADSFKDVVTKLLRKYDGVVSPDTSTGTVRDVTSFSPLLPRHATREKEVI
jgi:hypothetical protein